MGWVGGEEGEGRGEVALGVGVRVWGVGFFCGGGEIEGFDGVCEGSLRG